MRDIFSSSSTNDASLAALIKEMAPDVTRHAQRIVPSTFNASDPGLFAVPLPSEYSWESCTMALRSFGSTGVMMRLPLFLQLEPLVHAAARAVGAYIFVNDPLNIQVGALAAKQKEIDTVVTDIDDADRFGGHLVEHDTEPPPYWVVIRSLERARQKQAILLRGTHIAQEVHLFPGLPILTQCSELVERRSNAYHVPRTFTFVIARSGSLSLTSNAALPFSIKEYSPPFRVIPTGDCNCGATMIELID